MVETIPTADVVVAANAAIGSCTSFSFFSHGFMPRRMKVLPVTGGRSAGVVGGRR